MSRPRGALAGLSAAAALVLLAIDGCRSRAPNLPPLHKVHGQVVFKGGGPLPGGSIQFQSSAHPSLTIRGDIGKDGKFVLFTLAENKKMAGAPEGDHHVIVVPAQTENQVNEVVVVVQPFCTVKPGDNTLTIEVEKAAPSRNP